jgi:hypothetical protein
LIDSGFVAAIRAIAVEIFSIIFRMAANRPELPLETARSNVLLSARRRKPLEQREQK